MAVNGKQKGNNFEREISTLFSEVFCDIFKRVPQSGAIVGGKNRYIVDNGLRKDAVEIFAGDIITPDGFPFSIECKSYKDFEFHHILYGKQLTLDKWLLQAESDAKISNKESILIMKFVRKGCYVCTANLNIGGLYLTDILHNYYMYKKKYIFYTLEEFLEISKRINIINEWLLKKDIV